MLELRIITLKKLSQSGTALKLGMPMRALVAAGIKDYISGSFKGKFDTRWDYGVTPSEWV